MTESAAADNVKMLAMWSANRDQECPGREVGYVSPSCISILQAPGEFALIFNDFNTGQPTLPGDINADAYLDVLDVVLLVNAVLEYDFSNTGDLNQDGVMDILDVILLVNTIIGG